MSLKDRLRVPEIRQIIASHFLRSRARGPLHMKTPARRSYSIGSVQRCLQMLRLFGQAPGGLTPAEVGKLSGLPTSTVYRFLANLATAGFLTCSESGKYYLDVACFPAEQGALSHLDIRRLSLPYLKALNGLTRETVHLLVRQ